MKIGEKIREMRKGTIISLRDLENLTGISRINLSEIELGKLTPTIPMLEKIAEALECKIEFSISPKNIRPYPTPDFASRADREKIIETYEGKKIKVAWEESLKDGTLLYVYTPDPGLAMNIVQVFLNDMGKRNLWYEGRLSYPDYQEMRLTECHPDTWEGWSREEILSRKKYSNRRRISGNK